ncbi:hypothetical protein [Myceligenerans crystallogenes]|uniref:Uncharacterized protein n=1 Tax=Myceligenerans crystallogenes TaxID=316335 RepID=A0ABN2NF67_9MICO
MHVVVIAQGSDVAAEVAQAWRSAVPGVSAEARGVRVVRPPSPRAPRPPGWPGDAGRGDDSPSGDDAGPHGGPAADAARRAVVVAGTSLGIGAPPPEPPGPAAPRSALPAAEAAELSRAVASSDVVVARVAVLDAGSLRAGPVAEAAAAAAPHAVPVVALAERVEVSRRELASAGLSGAHEIEGADVARVARSWTPGWA